MSITGSNNPFACEPVVFANANSIVSLGTITRDGNQFTFSVGFVWKINGITYQNTAPVVLTISEASTGFQRIDNALLNTSNTIELQQGLESDTIALRPVAPETNIILTSWNISGSAIEDTETPILGTQFKKKIESSAFVDGSLSGEKAVIQLRPEGNSFYAITGAGLVSIDGFGLDLITGNPSTETPYSGKDLIIQNLTAEPFDLLHDGDGMATAKFRFFNGQNLTVPPQGVVWVKYFTPYCEVVLKSWSDDYLKKDISTYTPATTPLSGTEKALIHDGTDFKEVAVSEFIYTTDGKSYESLSVAMAVVPLPENNTIFYIDDSNLTERGVYAYDSNEVSGYRFVRDYTPNGVVEEGNTKAVSGGEVFEYTKGIVTESINLFDKDTDTIDGKTYNASGGLDNAVQRVSFELIKVSPSSYYALVGGNIIGNTSIRLCYFDINRQLIIYETAETTGQFPIRITTPSNCHYIGGVIGQSSDPIIRDGLKNTFMICKLSSIDDPLPNYESYGNKIKADNIEGFDDKVSTNPKFAEVEASIDTIKNVFDKSYLFDGNSKIDINDAKYYLNNIGDYFEIKVKADSDIQLFNQGLSLIGTEYSQNGVLGFYNTNSIYLRDEAGGTWKIFTHNKGIFVFNTIKLLINSDDKWELFFNETSVGVADRTGGFRISNIGQSHSVTYFFKGEIEYLKINIKKVDSEDFDLYNFTDLLAIPDSINTGVTEKLEAKNSSLASDYSEMYYEFSNTMYEGREGFNIFAKIKGSNKYVRYTVYRKYDMTELIYLDYYRLMECSEYVFNGVSMTPLVTTVLAGAENEFTMLQQGKADHSGGIHGDEIFTIARFKADGKLISTSGDIPLTPCSSFEYQIVSNIHETANSSTPEVPISGHPIIAEHVKTVLVSSEGLDITNVVNFKQAIPLVRAYLGIVCMGKEFATSGSTENGDVTAINDQDGSMKISNDMANTVYFSGGKGGSIITSELVNVYKPSLGNQEQKIYKDKLLTYVIDRNLDSKYYRIVGSRSESTVINVEIGEIWKMNCNVTFNITT